MTEHVHSPFLHRVWFTLGWVWVAAVIALSLMPQGAPLPGFSMSDKVGHALAYAGLMGWFAQLPERNRRRTRLALTLVCLGLLMEGLQGLQPTRATEWGDALANALGVFLGWWLATRTPAGRILRGLEARFA